jgi:cystathionine gamma-synthase
MSDSDSPSPTLHPATRAAQALGWIDPTTRAITPAIHPSTTFIRDADNQYRSGYSYTRDTNPTYAQAETLLAELEHGAQALLFSSGMAAATAVLQALPPGSHVLAPKVMYWGLRQWLLDSTQAADRLSVDFVDNGDLRAWQKLLRPGRTRLLWLETPANPTWSITDIAAAAGIAHAAGAQLCVDSTVATPVLTRPLELGADLVMHSATKYLNGHSDVLAGALITASREDALWQRIVRLRHDAGAIPGSFEAWLLVRGMRTLYLRVNQSCAGALRIAEHFSRHPQIAQVLYPGLPDHPDHAIAARQMQGGFGGMLSLRVKNGAAAAIVTAARVKLWKRATSLGGVESLIEHRASVEGPDTPVPGDLLRLSVGIEHSDDLIADLEQALAVA